jgi:dynein heavy chain
VDRLSSKPLDESGQCFRHYCTQIPAQARDNVKFLSTLERHFKTISSGPLAAVADCLLPLMSALRMVWIMSRHYGA